jgi:hypothetical protein
MTIRMLNRRSELINYFSLTIRVAHRKKPSTQLERGSLPRAGYAWQRSLCPRQMLCSRQRPVGTVPHGKCYFAESCISGSRQSICWGLAGRRQKFSPWRREVMGKLIFADSLTKLSAKNFWFFFPKNFAERLSEELSTKNIDNFLRHFFAESYGSALGKDFLFAKHYGHALDKAGILCVPEFPALPRAWP